MKLATEGTPRAAADAHREPFIWHNGEVSPAMQKSLAREYKNSGKPFLLSAHSASGVYPGEAHWLIPKNVGAGWIRKHLAPLVATTDLFPQVENIFFHSGDLGDIIASLPVIRQLGGGRLVIGHAPLVRNREAMRGARFEAIRPLLLAQDYITGVDYEDEPYCTYDLAHFRHDPIRGESLAHWQARHLGVQDLNVEPWLRVPVGVQNEKVVVARSLRYHNFFFPWKAIGNRYNGQTLFVGLPDEHKALQKEMGRAIPYQPTGDLLELAALIAGCKLFVGNQSAAFWIAVGLGVPLIQESWEQDSNSVIPRANARYTLTGPETRTLIYSL